MPVLKNNLILYTKIGFTFNIYNLYIKATKLTAMILLFLTEDAGTELVECKDNCLYIKDDGGKSLKEKQSTWRVKITNYVKFEVSNSSWRKQEE